jgi:hypothetical protein
MASSAEEVRLFLAHRAVQQMKGSCDAAAAVVAAASSAAAAAPAFADAAVAPPPAAASSNPKYGQGSRLSGAAKKTEQRRMRSYLSITNAEQQSVQTLFSNQPTRQIYLANGGASCGVSHAECHALLSQYGRLTRLVLIGQAPFALAEFENAEQSAKCHAALDAFIWNRGDAAGVDAADAERARQLFVQYAREDASTFLKEAKHALQIPNAVPLEQISPQSVCALDELPDVISQLRLACRASSVRDRHQETHFMFHLSAPLMISHRSRCAVEWCRAWFAIGARFHQRSRGSVSACRGGSVSLGGSAPATSAAPRLSIQLCSQQSRRGWANSIIGGGGSNSELERSIQRQQRRCTEAYSEHLPIPSRPDALAWSSGRTATAAAGSIQCICVFFAFRCCFRFCDCRYRFVLAALPS